MYRLAVRKGSAAARKLTRKNPLTHKMNHTLTIIILAITLSSCIQYPALVNFNEGPRFPATPQAMTNFQPLTVQPDDILHITVHSIDPEAVTPFNLVQMNRGGGGGMINREAMQLTGYLVDGEGYIDFPVLGRIKVGELPVRSIKDMIREQLITAGYLKDPVVNIRILNYRVKVMGEVAQPGVYQLPNERVSIMEALTMAGDLTQYGRRDSILIVREQQGEQVFGYIDLNSTASFQSPYFFLQQNDLLYVQPLQTKINTVRDPAQRVLPWISAATSLTALIVAILR